MGGLQVSVAKGLHSFSSQLSRTCSSKRNVLFFFLFLIQFSNGGASLFWIEFISLD